METVKSIQKTARFAGIAYFVIIITSLLSMVVGPYKLIIEGDMLQTIDNIASNQILYRVGMAYEVLMYMGVIFLSVALYHILKIVNKPYALTALLCRFGEAISGLMTVIGSIIVLSLITRDPASESHQYTISLVFEIKDALMSVLMVFIGTGSIIFFYLFYKSGFIPKILSLFGIVSFALVLLETLVLIILPMNPWVFPGLMAVVFEITVGLWLMIKGISIDKVDLILNK